MPGHLRLPLRWGWHTFAISTLTVSCGGSSPHCRTIDTSIDPGAPPKLAATRTAANALNGIVMPSPESVTLEEPGGDAPDAHAASLAKMIETPFGWVGDKDGQVRIMLPDSGQWKRVRYHGFEHLTGFRYGMNHHAISVVLVADTRQGRAPTSESCMRHAETLARPRARELAVETQAIIETKLEWRGKSLIMHSTDGQFPFGFRRVEFSAAWVAYPAYESSCLYQVFAAQYEGHPDLARKLRNRWMKEAATQVNIRTTTKPFRHE